MKNSYLNVVGLAIFLSTPLLGQEPGLYLNFPKVNSSFTSVPNSTLNATLSSDEAGYQAGSYAGSFVPQFIKQAASELVTSAQSAIQDAYETVAQSWEQAPELRARALKSAQDKLATVRDQAGELLEAAISYNAQLAAQAGVPEEYQRSAGKALLGAEAVAAVASAYGLYKALGYAISSLGKSVGQVSQKISITFPTAQEVSLTLNEAAFKSLPEALKVPKNWNIISSEGIAPHFATVQEMILQIPQEALDKINMSYANVIDKINQRLFTEAGMGWARAWGVDPVTQMPVALDYFVPDFISNKFFPSW
jgi:hypothetical protein